MAKQYFRKKLLLCKVEATYGTDSAPTNVANAFQTRNVKVTPLTGEQLSYELDKATFGADPSEMVGQHGVLEFEVLAGGAGTAGNAPAYAAALLACGYAEDLDPGVEAVYTPQDEDPDSVTLWWYHGLTLHKFVGGRGSVQLVCAKRKYPVWKFRFMGLYSTPTAGTVPVPTLTAFVKPLAFSAASVSASIFGVTVGAHEATFDFGQSANFYEHSEEESIQIEDREGQVNIQIEAPEIATRNFYNDASVSTSGAVSYVHGTTAGNIIEIDVPAFQITSIADEEVQGIKALRLTGPMSTDGSAADATITIR